MLCIHPAAAAAGDSEYEEDGEEGAAGEHEFLGFKGVYYLPACCAWTMLLLLCCCYCWK
jgi:hypothetical protein